MLAITYTCSKFHYIIYEQRKVNIFTDHKPLVSIMNKELHKIPNNRLKRLLIKLIIYDISVYISVYISMYVANYLNSNFIITKNTPDADLGDTVYIVNEIEVVYWMREKKNLWVQQEMMKCLNKITQFILLAKNTSNLKVKLNTIVK